MHRSRIARHGLLRSAREDQQGALRDQREIALGLGRSQRRDDPPWSLWRKDRKPRELVPSRGILNGLVRSLSAPRTDATEPKAQCQHKNSSRHSHPPFPGSHLSNHSNLSTDPNLFTDSTSTISLEIAKGQRLEIQYDIFNVLNLLSSDWGHFISVTGFETANVSFLRAVDYDAVNRRPKYAVSLPSRSCSSSARSRFNSSTRASTSSRMLYGQRRFGARRNRGVLLESRCAPYSRT